MKLLVLGGTRFLSREVAARAVGRGWDVTCACRGTSGPVPEGARHLRWDRADPPPAEVVDGGWDAVVDVGRLPSQVSAAVAATPDAHWVFVSTVSVYADNASPAMEPLLDPITDDVDLAVDPEAYGGMKVACEQAVTATAASAVVVRPGSSSDRATRPAGSRTGRGWPRGGEVLAPGRPEDVVQVIDVRDLADWLLVLAEQRTTGTYDAVGTRRRSATCWRASPRASARGTRASPGSTRRSSSPTASSPGGRGLAAAVAAPPRLRRHAPPRPRTGGGRRPAAATAGRDRTRVPRRPRDGSVAGARGGGAGGLARPLRDRATTSGG